MSNRSEEVVCTSELQEIKRRFSEVFDLTREERPRMVTSREQKVVVIVSVAPPEPLDADPV